MKVWVDALTGKHIRYATALANKLEKNNHAVLLTSRSHPDTLPLIWQSGQHFHVYGSYGTSLREKLAFSIERQQQLLELITSWQPDIAISHCSPDQARLAHGLNIPLIFTSDSPQADAVNTLTIPYADHVIISECLPTQYYKRLNVSLKVHTFHGVDEVAWAKPVSKHQKIVLRNSELSSSYSWGLQELGDLVKPLSEIAEVTFLSRTSHADVDDCGLFVGIGGTMTRELALHGTPAIVILSGITQFVNPYLAKLGFPIVFCQKTEVSNMARNLYGAYRDASALLGELENPVDKILEVAETYG